MPIMSAVESGFCRSAPWSWFADRAVLPWALREVSLSGDVLEIGGGTGAMAEATARRFPEADLTVTDLDPAMVARAGRRLSAHPRVSVRTADVTRMPFADESFDTVTSHLMLHHVIEWRAALGEVARVLRPGGRLVGYDLTDTALARLVHRVDGSPHLMVAPADLAAELDSLGFRDVDLTTSAVGHLMRFRATLEGVAP